MQAHDNETAGSEKGNLEGFRGSKDKVPSKSNTECDTGFQGEWKLEGSEMILFMVKDSDLCVSQLWPL